jgi:hypothetical protein
MQAAPETRHSVMASGERSEFGYGLYQHGSVLFGFGALSSLLRLVDYDLMLFVWTDMWGEAIGWGIRIGMMLMGSIMLLAARQMGITRKQVMVYTQSQKLGPLGILLAVIFGGGLLFLSFARDEGGVFILAGKLYQWAGSFF